MNGDEQVIADMEEALDAALDFVAHLRTLDTEARMLLLAEEDDIAGLRLLLLVATDSR